MKNDDNVLFDDNETAEDLLITDMTDEEIEMEFNRIFSNKHENSNKYTAGSDSAAETKHVIECQ